MLPSVLLSTSKIDRLPLLDSFGFILRNTARHGIKLHRSRRPAPVSLLSRILSQFDLLPSRSRSLSSRRARRGASTDKNERNVAVIDVTGATHTHTHTHTHTQRHTHTHTHTQRHTESWIRAAPANFKIVSAFRGRRNERAAEINSYAIQIKMSIFGRG